MPPPASSSPRAVVDPLPVNGRVATGTTVYVFVTVRLTSAVPSPASVNVPDGSP